MVVSMDRSGPRLSVGRRETENSAFGKNQCYRIRKVAVALAFSSLLLLSIYIFVFSLKSWAIDIRQIHFLLMLIEKHDGGKRPSIRKMSEKWKVNEWDLVPSLVSIISCALRFSYRREVVMI